MPRGWLPNQRSPSDLRRSNFGQTGRAAKNLTGRTLESILSARCMTAGLPRSFAERLIVETTDRRWTWHAETMLHGQAIPTAVIGLRALRDSQVDWSAFAATGELARPEPKTLRKDQIEALEAVRAGLTEAERGKLIMACGTGKTLTGLRIAEELAGSGGQILFLVPSLALMAQTVRE